MSISFIQPFFATDMLMGICVVMVVIMRASLGERDIRIAI
jgi:hypothetical protein